MKTTCYIDVPEKENGHGVSVRKLHENDHVQVAHIKLKPGEKVNPHTTPVDVFFYILEGTCTVEIGTERQQVSKDTLIESPARIPHAIYNESGQVARIMVVKTPRPGKQ
jgi:mannose-6-phosphate isomerase-like protein (cupin superfamily)